MGCRGRVFFLLLAIAGAFAVVPARAGPPELVKPTIVDHPTAWTTEDVSTFSFSSSDAGVTFLCRLDSGEPPPGDDCASPVVYDSVTEGPHSFQVRATDSDGNWSTPRTFSWTVDRTPPRLPSDMTVEATSSAGAVVSFAASDNLDPAPRLDCAPTSGVVFRLGTTPVTCTAVDAAGNETRGDFSVRVVDTTPPMLAPHVEVLAAQASSVGAAVAYKLPTARDAGDPSPVVECSPASGGVFPIGETVVTCTAVDAFGNESTPVMFRVIVQEGPTPVKPTLAAHVPRLTKSVSASFDFSVEKGATVRCKLAGPGGPGSFVPCASQSSQTYTALGEGAYLFTVQATNAIGNVSQASYGWTIDLSKPAAVSRFRTRAADGRVRLTWTKPIDADYARVKIWRKRSGGRSWKLLATRVSAGPLVDRSPRNDKVYRYRIRSFDAAGNASVASDASGRPSKIVSPAYGAVLARPPLIDWKSVRRAGYYNMQVWRNGRKILSVWPLRSRYRLRTHWTFKGKRYSMSAGRYVVYVWPGFGPKRAAVYGPLLGWTSFRKE
jgi:hypothetical protein